MKGMQEYMARVAAREKKRARVLAVVLAVVIFAGMFLQITMLSRISGQQKASQARGRIEKFNKKYGMGAK